MSPRIAWELSDTSHERAFIRPGQRTLNCSLLAATTGARIPGEPNHVAAYLNPAGGPTVGYCHTRGVALGQVITVEQAEAFLREDLTGSEAAVRTLVKGPLTENQFTALVSFTFNLGAAILKRSTLFARLNQGNFAGVLEQFSRFVFARGRCLPGLVRRRAAECALFLTGSEAAHVAL
jgi:GH24 family phage-related lysozyme (muramidase)